MLIDGFRSDFLFGNKTFLNFTKTLIQQNKVLNFFI